MCAFMIYVVGFGTDSKKKYSIKRFCNQEQFSFTVQ